MGHAPSSLVGGLDHSRSPPSALILTLFTTYVSYWNGCFGLRNLGGCGSEDGMSTPGMQHALMKVHPSTRDPLSDKQGAVCTGKALQMELWLKEARTTGLNMVLTRRATNQQVQHELHMSRKAQAGGLTIAGEGLGLSPRLYQESWVERTS